MFGSERRTTPPPRRPQDDKVPSEINKLKEENRQLRLELARLDSTIQHLFEELRRVRQRSTK